VRRPARLAAVAQRLRAFVFAEADYRYGVGRLTLRVERIDRGHPVEYDGELWLWVEGVQLGHNGVEVGRRRVLIRLRCLPAALLAQRRSTSG
jgi:hypothetical protein